MKGKDMYVPLPELDSATDRIHSTIQLPTYINQEAILVNAGLIDYLNKLSATEVTFGAFRDEGSTSVSVTGFTGEGGAFASKIKRDEAPLTRDSSNIDERHRGLAHAFQRQYVKVDLNMATIEERVREAPEGIRSLQPWSKELDKAFQTGVRRGNVKALTVGLDRFDRFMTGMNIATFSADIYKRAVDQAGFTSHDSQMILLNIALVAALYYPFKYVAHKRGKEPEGVFSIFGPFAPKLDRALIVSAIARTSNFVKIDPQIS